MEFQTSNHAIIANIAIDPEYQGHGFGGKLMSHAEHLTKNRIIVGDAIGDACFVAGKYRTL